METVLKEILLVFTSILVLSFLLRQNRKNGQVRVISGVITGVLLYYCIVPALIILYQEDALSSGISYLVAIAEADLLDTMLAVFRILFFLITYCIVYRAYNNRSAEKIYTVSETKLIRITKLFTWGTFIIGGLSFAIYVRAFGGIGVLLSYANYLRSFSTSASSVIPYLASIMVIPARLITVTPILIIILLGYNKQNRYTFLYKVMFIMSLVGAIIFSLANAGRTLIITYVMCFVIPLIQKIVKKPWRFTFIIGAFSLPLLDYLDALFQYLQKGEFIVQQSSTLNYLRQFAYPFANVLSVLAIVKQSGLRYCKDFITGVLNIVPGVNFQPSYEVTSFFYGGNLWKRTGGTPNDIITFGYIEFGLIGVFIVAILLGVITGKVDRLLGRFNDQYASNVLRTTVIVNFFCLVVNADIVSIVRSQFLLIIPCICLLYSTTRIRDDVKMRCI